MTYDEGYKAGKADALDGFKPKASRRWKTAYRDGYSDGYFAHSKQEKVW